MKPIVIGVAGGSGSGKTTVARRLKEEFQEDLQLLCHDWYYLPHDDQTYEERAKINYDHPDAFDQTLFMEQLIQLREGNAIEHPVYNYRLHNRANDWEHMEPRKIIVVDGILIFSDSRIRDLLDMKVFVDTDADERLVRRIIRDVKERGRSLDSVIEQYLTTVKPMHEQFVEPSKRYADIIIPRGGENIVALDMLIHRLKSLLSS